MKRYTCRLVIALLFAAGIALAQQNAQQKAEQFFRQNDKNNDGFLSKQEFPEKLMRMFDRIDANKDGSISLSEDTAFRSGQRKRDAKGKPPQQNRGTRPTDPAGTEIIRDIVYASPNGSDQKLDIYLPPNPEKKPLPVSVWIHGGGWRNGKKGNTGRVRNMLNDGFALVDIDYRLSGEAIFPAQVQDCKAAIRWIRANAKKYNFDPNRIGISGGSAGGHLVSFLGTTGSTREYDVGDNLDYSSAVQAVCNWYGPSDLLRMDEMAVPGATMKHSVAGSPESLLVGGTLTEEPYKSLVKKVNPITYITGDEPPFLHLHGDDDKLVPPGQSEILHAALKKAGVDSTLYIVKGGGHGLRGGSGKDSSENLEKKAAEFLKKHLGVKK
ncbi:MAG: alpha/beta hydrolase fold domain-containing protein [Kiritimatiellales bacterium]|nr:alpha/beta hydrolase fold domain-containing protein [Kiritimatiellales bacterium]